MDLIRSAAIGILLGGALMAGNGAQAQLRPYEPAPWDALRGTAPIEVALGTRYLADQEAALAGVRGDLLQLGLLQVSVRSGPVVIRVLGTPWQRLAIDQQVEPPATGTREPGDRSISGVGDFLIETVVPLPEVRDVSTMLRFGTRLPTTDNRVGLERDRIDFHALIGARGTRGALMVAGELGVGIHGTREVEYEQSDVLIFIGAAEWRGPLRVGAELVGHADGLADRSIRGNEELAEVRVYARSRGALWMRGEAILGLMEMGPSRGIGLQVGATLP